MNTLEQRIEQAAKAREEAEASLLRPDGSRRYSDEEHEERTRTIRREHAERFGAIEAEIAGRVERAEERLFGLEHADPSGALSTEELERANARSAFVADECRGLPLGALAKRMAAVLASGDRPTMFLYAHHAGLRVGEPRAYDPHNPAARDEDGSPAIREAVADLRAALDPEREREAGKAKEALAEARKLWDRAYLRRRGATSASGLLIKEKYGDTAQRFGLRAG